MTVAIIGNDFDESLLKYKTEPRFHYFAEDGSLTRVDYQLSTAKKLLRHSATLRYVMLNLDASHRLNALQDSWRGGVAYAEAGTEPEALEVMDTIRAMPDAYRETLILRLVEGLTGPEIAEQTGLTADSVRVNLHRGMKMLREKLEGKSTR